MRNRTLRFDVMLVSASLGLRTCQVFGRIVSFEPTCMRAQGEFQGHLAQSSATAHFQMHLSTM